MIFVVCGALFLNPSAPGHPVRLVCLSSERVMHQRVTFQRRLWDGPVRA